MKMKKALIGALSASMLLSAAVSSVPTGLGGIIKADALTEDERLDYIDDEVKIEYTVSPAGAAIRNIIFFKKQEEYTIPEKIDGHRVIELAESSLASEKDVEGLIVPKCVRYIRGGAFSGSDFKWIRFENPDIYIDIDYFNIGTSTQLIGYTGSDVEVFCVRNWRNFVAIDQQVTDGTVNGILYMDGVAVTGSVDAEAEDIVIPEEINGLPVVCIQYGAFMDNSSIKSVVIPSSVKNIRFNAFSDCPNLEKVTLENGIEELGESVFSGCPALKEITIPESVKNIGANAFSDCPNLEKVELPETVDVTGGNAFRNTPWFESVADKSGITVVGGVLLDGHGFEGGELVIPDGVKVIGDGAFSGMENITSLTVPEGVSKIGANAFADCSGLESVTLPDSLSDIGYGAFSGCKLLKRVSLGSGLKNIESNSFEKCVSLTDIVLPDTVEQIGYSAFKDCTSLEKVNIPGSVKSIRSNAFSGCTSLTDIDFSQFESAETDMNIFYNVPWLEAEKKKSEMVIAGKMVLDGTQCTGDITIPDGIVAIAGYAFKDSGITSVTFPETTTVFGFGAFASCNELTEFTIPDGTEKISSGMFSGCNSLKKVNIPESVKTIDNGAFLFCSGLTEFTVPVQVEAVIRAFEYCDHLKTITIENPDCIVTGDSENFLAMPMNTTVRGYAGSNAYWFARYSGRKFETIYTLGDINNDGEINISDAVVLQKWLNGGTEPMYNWQAADFTGDEVVNMFDLVLLKQKITEN